MQGRPRKRGPEDRLTSVSLDKEARLAVKRLQLHREAQDCPSSFRDIVLEGIALVLAKEGLEPMRQPEIVPHPAVVEIKGNVRSQRINHAR
jgi:hypothetical protein